MSTRDPGPAWLRHTAGEQRVPALLAIVAAIGLQAGLQRRFLLVPPLALVIPEVLLLLTLLVSDPVRIQRDSALVRKVSLVLTGVITAANTGSAVLLVRDLISDQRAINDAGTLLATGALVYATNIVAFGLWYWELDRGGPRARARADKPYPDLLFPQMATPDIASRDWEPVFFDYLYVSFTNATAFSPTDTMPLTRWMKALMLVQSAVALVTVGLVIARAVNVLK